MSQTFDSANRYQFLAAQRAALTKALKLYHKTEDEDGKIITAAKAANIVNRAPTLGFTQEEVSSGADLPKEILSLITPNDAAAKNAGGNPCVEAKEAIEAMDTTFGLERDLQRNIRANIGLIDPTLHIVDGGKERTVPSGRIDILAEDQHGKSVVIELKAGQADHGAVVQALTYMGDLGRTTQGILIAGEFTPRAISAARVSPNIRLLKYSIKFNFSPVTDDPPSR